MMGNAFGNIMGFIIGLRGGAGFTIRSSRVITSGGLTIGGGGGFHWLIVDWKTLLFDNVELIKAWKFIEFPKVSFVT